ncbi:MAG: DNA repair protein RecN [Parvibaculales bacterium]
MLVSLSIRDIVLIEKLDLVWQHGLCALTGETGAGKSILLDALALAMGARGDGNLVRQGAEQGQVVAAFEVPDTHEAMGLLRANDLPFDGQVILRRVQTKDGRSRAFINDQPVSVGLLNSLGAALVEIHGQNESQSLTDTQTQRRLLDAYAGLDAQLITLRAQYGVWQDKQKALLDYEQELNRINADESYLRHALEELQTLNPQAGEEAALAAERTLLMNAEKISTDLNEALSLIGGERGMQESLSACLRRLEKIAPQAAGSLDDAVKALERALVETDEANAMLNEAGAKLVFDPARLQEVEDRLFALKDQARKHQVDADALPDMLLALGDKLAAIDKGGHNLEALRTELAVARRDYEQLAEEVSGKRAKAAEQLDAAVGSELSPLKLDMATFVTRLETVPLEQGTENGIDKVSFMASTNPGMPQGAISKIASGGELARFMLALKVALAGASPQRTLVFDEVDSGVGGAVAQAVGARLRTLAGSGQVLVVTHSPQVAASGDHQWRISKQADSDSTFTRVQELSQTEREEEIARMLSGAEVNDAARQAAVELLEA